VDNQQEVTAMIGNDSKELKVREKQEVATSAEQTKPGLVFTPAVDIFENETEIVLLADMPGVKAQDLNIDLRDNTLTLDGGVEPFEASGEEAVLMEFEVGKYFRKFSLSEVIDQEKIDAQLKDGVLRLTLPKVEKATPRTITVQAG
jgi:HSP20 family molecular chaperone IbpA